MALILTKRWHGRLSLDHDLEGVQKLHTQPVPRVGGIGIALGLIGGSMALLASQNPIAETAFLLILCSVPAFAAGLLEDLTKRVSVGSRLIASFISGGLAVFLLNARLTDLDTPGLDALMQIGPVAILFTCFAVGGVTNAVNIIDGLNGLASGAVTIMLAGLGVIAWTNGDALVTQLCLLGMAALTGFATLNYLTGRIFMGDGGAYLAGFWLAECAILLLARNPNISTWAPLLCCIYPVWETGFSMYRRYIVERVSSGLPDMKHLHHLILQRFVAQKFPGSVHKHHRISSALIWLMVALCQLMAAIESENTHRLAIGLSLSVLIYLYFYVKLERTQKPPEHSNASDSTHKNLIPMR